MAQTAAAYLLVAAAAAWVVWSMVLPKGIKQAIRARLFRRKPAATNRAGCDCGGSGGCH